MFYPPAPCVPSNVVVNRNCNQSFMEVAWQASRGAKNYLAAAVGKDGSHLQCVSNMTSCRMDGLICSQVYDVSVAAVDDTCTSTGSPTVTHPTGKNCQISVFCYSEMCTFKSSWVNSYCPSPQHPALLHSPTSL